MVSLWLTDLLNPSIPHYLMCFTMHDVSSIYCPLGLGLRDSAPPVKLYIPLTMVNSVLTWQSTSLDTFKFSYCLSTQEHYTPILKWFTPIGSTPHKYDTLSVYLTDFTLRHNCRYDFILFCSLSNGYTRPIPRRVIINLMTYNHISYTHANHQKFIQALEAGLEPTTHRLTICCTTVVLH